MTIVYTIFPPAGQVSLSRLNRVQPNARPREMVNECGKESWAESLLVHTFQWQIDWDPKGVGINPTTNVFAS